MGVEQNNNTMEDATLEIGMGKLPYARKRSFTQTLQTQFAMKMLRLLKRDKIDYCRLDSIYQK